MEDEYVDDLKRMALALTSAQMAKDVAVREHGIGEDINTHFLGWSSNQLVLICQMGSDLQKTSHENRIQKSGQACAIMRKCWWITSLTMVAEGFCSLDAVVTRGMDLSQAFLNSKLPVYECLTVTHANSDTPDSEVKVSMVAVPYKCELGKIVKWNEALVYPENTATHIFPSHYSTMLQRALSGECENGQTREFFDKAKNEIKSLGFSLQELF